MGNLKAALAVIGLVILITVLAPLIQNGLSLDINCPNYILGALSVIILWELWRK